MSLSVRKFFLSIFLIISSSICFSFGPHKIKKKYSPSSFNLLIRLMKFCDPHLVVGPDDPTPRTILKFLLFNSLFIFSIFSLLIKNFVSVLQSLILRKFSVKDFAVLTKCKFLFLKKRTQ